MQINVDLFNRLLERYTLLEQWESQYDFLFSEAAILAKKMLLKYGCIDCLDREFIEKHVIYKRDFVHLKANRHFGLICLEMPDLIADFSAVFAGDKAFYEDKDDEFLHDVNIMNFALEAYLNSLNPKI